MRKMLCIVVLLVVALFISADLPRAGPDQADSITATELSFAGDLAVDLAAIAELNFVADYSFESNFTVADLAAANSRREEVVQRDLSHVQLVTYNDTDASGYLTIFRDKHRQGTAAPLLT